MSEKNEVRQRCCAEWARAHEPHTDHELYGAFIGYDDEASALPASGDDFIIHFCPFCGVKKDPIRAGE
jgi:hypothetical protein